MKKDSKYLPNEIEPRWQEKWESDKTYSPNIEAASSSDSELPRKDKKPFYNLMMFPYPSAEGLHVGNMYAFTGADVYGRFKRMQGNDVFEPIGLDGFGIHSENYALKVGRHPQEQSKIAEKNFYRQLRSIGNGFDLTRTVETYNPDYYKWTQWLFIQLFKAGLAYRKKAEVNWCPSCLTVLSDEQVISGECERCGSQVEKKDLEQWFFRITDYAQRLLDNIEGLDWTNKVKIAQRNWIGRSEGAELGFSVEGLGDSYRLRVFTTRPDTLYGATFMVVSPEHELVAKLLGESRSTNQELRDYVEKAKNKTDIERTADDKEKTGVFSGIYAINPVNGKKIPVWVADYVLSSYGTGAIMAVPAHDQRDFEFANKYNLEIIPVIKDKESDDSNVKMEKAFIGKGDIIGSEDWNGFHVPQEIGEVINDLEKKGIGTKKVNYHLRDWLISRQRYWGPPIPMIYCDKCASEGKSWFTSSEADVQRLKINDEGLKNESSKDRQVKDHKSSILNHNSDVAGWPARHASQELSGVAGWYPVPESDLPVLLPEVDDWKPMGTGLSPLANHPEFYEVACPECGSDARRETDVSDTFLDSAWYFLRYPNTDISTLPFDTERVRKWLPVDQYIGGAEHSVLHLLYSRFITMVLKDLGYLEFEEPFSKFYAHGLIIKDGAKMSKSKGNVVVPDEYIAKYGADALRTYLMFIGPYSDGGDFTDSGIEGIYRFLKRVWTLFLKTISNDESLISNNDQSPITGKVSSELDRVMNRTIKGVTEDLENLRYNTAIAKLMEYYNALNEFYSKDNSSDGRLDTKYVKNYLLLLAPFAPHMTEELYQRLKINDEGLKSESSKEQQEKDHKSSILNLKSIHLSSWPEFDPSMVLSDTFTIVIQVNGKRRGELRIKAEELSIKEDIEKSARGLVSKHLEGKEIKKTIYIKGKIINFVI